MITYTSYLLLHFMKLVPMKLAQDTVLIVIPLLSLPGGLFFSSTFEWGGGLS